MKMLILGGTEFLGRHIAAEALKNGMEITLFNRGKTNPDFLKDTDGVTHIAGDRQTEDITLLSSFWDVVIDTSGREPEDVKRSVSQLKQKCSKYVFISSISAYKDLSKGPVYESDELHDLNQGGYASNKATAEQIVTNEFSNNLIIRPGLIVGPNDPTDRFTYWPWRMHQGGDIVVPNISQETPIQFIDVRDLAMWVVNAVEQDLTGIYNATGPNERLSYRKFLNKCHRTLSPDNTKLHWIDEGVLLENEVEPWMDLPLWIPDSLNMNGMLEVNVDKAVKAGLHFRPMDETIMDTLNWSLEEHTGSWSAGLNKEKERLVLKHVTK
ncbi:NAD-dependent epimerase/dehydratase family protein [Virgibacillus flavescens]|uniref:NAD-dependent epimerase/dehydratase family protein n=1 Tax=Virgibacillus flavescens TaxID=1611422 RepID=UPI003D3507D9